MRLFVALAFAAVAAAQNPIVQIVNKSHPGGTDFRVGDRFEIAITGRPAEPVSVRTVSRGRTDWGAVSGWTDETGHWRVAGQFEPEDFGDWSELWTVGGKLATPEVHFSVSAPCMERARGLVLVMGTEKQETCRTRDGDETFVTPAENEHFWTPDGRVSPGRKRWSYTPDQFHMEVMESLIETGANDARPGPIGDEAAALILGIIGPNGLSDGELRNVLGIVRAAFQRVERVPVAARTPVKTLELLKRIKEYSADGTLRTEFEETVAMFSRMNMGTTAGQ